MRTALVWLSAVIVLGACATRGGDGAVRAATEMAPALAAYVRGDTDAALAALDPLLALEPWHVPAHRLRQDALTAAGRGEEARTLYQRTAEAAPDDPQRALLGARVTPREGGARLAAYRAALALDTESAWAGAALATELLVTARELGSKATEQRDSGYPDDAAVLEARRDAALAEAAGLAGAAVERTPDLSAAHEALAAVLRVRAATGEAAPAELLELAVAAQATAARLAPDDPRPLARLAELRRSAGDDAGAAAAFRAALALDPADGALLAGLGRVLLDGGDATDAAAVLGQAVAARPEDPLLLLDLGVAQQRAGDLDASFESLRQASTMAPGDPRALRALALVAEERERRDAPAREDLR